MGNSEIGHLTIGSGQILAQSIVRIDELFETKKFEKLPAYETILKRAKENVRIHLMGLLGPGGVHAHTNHLLEFIKILPENISINLHLFADGRDTAPTSFLGYLEDFLEKINERKNIKIASISGRYYAMDRDTNWDRNQKAYDAIMGNTSPSHKNPLDWIQTNYIDGITDEFLKPISFEIRDPIEYNEVIVLLNFRSDRAKQLARIFTDIDFVGFERKYIQNLEFATMTRYYPEFRGTVFIEDKKPTNILGEILERNHIPQLHIAETEKFAHVTKFFNG